MPIDFSKTSTFSTPEESPGFLLWRVSTLWRRKIEEVLKPIGLTHPQFVILATTAWLTRKNEAVTQVQIGKEAGLDPNTTSQILRSLQSKGYIERSRKQDERSKSPSLTKKGGEVLKEALPAVERADAFFFDPVDVKKTGFLSALQKLS